MPKWLIPIAVVAAIFLGMLLLAGGAAGSLADLASTAFDVAIPLLTISAEIVMNILRGITWVMDSIIDLIAFVRSVFS